VPGHLASAVSQRLPSPRAARDRLGADTLVMRPTYDDELATLPDTYAQLADWDNAPLAEALGRLSASPTSFVAAGGMSAVATLAARMHEATTARPASAITPLAAISRPPLRDSGTMLLTSSAKHPDALEIIRRLGRPGLRPGVVLTHRTAADVPGLPPGAVVVSLPALGLREGFLAVNSVLSMATALAHGYGFVLPASLPTTSHCPWPATVDRLLVLYPPQLEAVAVDLETRCSELGLAAIQAVDLRNFAHGRHTGLSRRLGCTTILALSDSDTHEFTEATLAVLPPAATIRRWHSALAWPASALELLTVSMRACGELATSQGVSASRPKVPVFGRRLYRLPIRRRLPDVRTGPVERKLGPAGPGEHARALSQAYLDALDAWKAELSHASFGAVVLDYDGTVCETDRRFDLPPPEMAAALSGVLERGGRLAFASGRGPSLQRDLRKVIAAEHWPRVELGLYNGGVLCRLDEELDDLRAPSALIRDAVTRLRTLPVAPHVTLEPRCCQVTIEPLAGLWTDSNTLAEMVQGALDTAPALAMKVVRSGHSLDVVAATTTKVAVVERIRDLAGPVEVLCIGDQGHATGNDFELLAHDRWSLSVDRCSIDPSRCWYLGDGSLSGPSLLIRYLNALRPRRGGLGLRAGSLP
jgi:hydroxymethylpyrimidine pyrophosphatase-like HAD family hydrolase